MATLSPPLAALALLAACGGAEERRACELEITLDAPVADECYQLCGQVTGSKRTTFVIESDVAGELYEGRTDSQGRADFCLARGLALGEHTLTTRAPESEETCEDHVTSLEVRPFGYAFGLEKPIEPLEAVPWVPELTGLDDPPVLEPLEGSWSANVVSMPTTVELDGELLMYFSGRDNPTEYRIGVAAQREDGTFERLTEDSLFPAETTGAVEGDWNWAAQNTPEAIPWGDGIRLYYNGDRGDDVLNVGAADSPDGVSFTQHPDNPIFTIDDLERAEDRGNSVAHLSIIQRGEVYEAWFATGTLWIGYAISADGETFVTCSNPVFEGMNTWDESLVKAPEVVYEDGLYWMTFTGGDKGYYQVGWAVSSDGIRWVAHPDPLIPAQGGDRWNAEATQGAEIDVEGDTWRFWYAASDGDRTSIGLAEAIYPGR